MKKEMNKERQYLNYIYNMIIDKSYDVARKRIDELRTNSSFRNYSFEIEYLNNFLEEQMVFYGEENEKIQEFLSDGRDCLYYGEIEEALNYFSAGAYLTDCPLFYYMMGKTLYNTQDRREEGVKYIEEYINKKGSSKAYKAYGVLEDYYYYIDKDKSKKYQKKKDKLMLISSMNYVRKDREVVWDEIKEVEALGKNKEIEKLYELFPNSTDEIKLRIIGELYKRGYKNQADDLYKKNKRKIQKHSKNSKRLVNELDKNRTLFINKGKHDING